MQANELRRGMNVLIDGRPFRVLESEIRSPGKGRAFIPVKLRSILDGTQREIEFSTADQVAEAAIETRNLDDLYAELDGAPIGLTLQVPAFVESGQRIRVDPTEKRYIERVK